MTMMLSLQCCALRQFKVTDGQNMCGQIKSDKRSKMRVNRLRSVRFICS